ncbi:hypothetical protein MMIC_P1962 [Mariprofundus micogutta]|uniref:Uncharacterized protein n=1 Tax=Mariprofundus micogutta TaxID=1921010 RepID=A0A1L8CQ26_9PROT|nr:DUF4936 family protein [Mariprofundus micogutta]GAV20984.1 hypothetical protein MMIC_P1962 [Mariprofundus micogutta]
MPDAFIWYHAHEKLESELMSWLDEIEDKAGVRGKLFVRKDDGKTTFMESYSDVTTSTITRIEKHAAQHPVFTNIERRCESFMRIDKL